MSSNEATYVSMYTERSATCSTYLNTVISIAKSKPTIVQHIDLTPLETEVNKLSQAIVAQKGFTQTERLRAADKKRDTRLSAIGYSFRGFAMFEDEKQADAKDLLVVLNSYSIPDVRKSPYNDETAKIKSIINRFRTSPHQEKMANFPLLVEWFNALEQDNNEFEAIMNEKASELDLSYGATKEIIADIIPLYRDFIKGINAHAFIGTDPEFDAFIEEHNAQVKVQHLD